MKRGLVILLIGVLLLSFVFAQNDLSTSNDGNDSENEIKNESDDDGQNEIEVELETENEGEDSNLENRVQTQLRENFCGTSTLGACEEDEDCIVGGCSQAVCQGASEEPAITTCEFRECYNATKYDAECKCEDKKCRWDRLTSDEVKKIRTEKNRIKFNATWNCPKNCTCSGSTIKCFLNGTRELTINAGNSGNIIIQIKGINATTNVTLYKSDDGKLYAVSENNETKEIKILPDEVRERIMERKQLENENISLDENGTYRYEVQKRARLFFLFSVKEKVEARINSETGEVLELKNPWWGFLAKDEESTDEDLAGGTMLEGSESNLTDEELAAA